MHITIYYICDDIMYGICYVVTVFVAVAVVVVVVAVPCFYFLFVNQSINSILHYLQPLAFQSFEKFAMSIFPFESKNSAGRRDK